LDRLRESAQLRAYETDPCQRALAKDLHANVETLTTLHCPKVHLSLSPGGELNYLQMLMPLDSLALPQFEAPRGENYMLELLCKVYDAQVVKVEE